MVEEWKTIDGTDGKYSVSTLWQVRCNGYSFSAFNGRSVCTINHKQRILNGSLNKWGYVSVDICGKTRLVHRLVATAFIDNPEDKPCINHIDGNKKNNSVSNLEWVTVKENNLHAIETGLRPSGDRYPHSKLTSEQVKEIRMNHVPGKVGTGCKILARKYGVHHSVIQNIINGKKWRHEDGSSI